MKALINTISLLAGLIVLLGTTACDSNKMSTMPIDDDFFQKSEQNVFTQETSWREHGTPEDFPMFINNQYIGYLMVWNDRNNLYATFGSTNGWVFAGTNLQISLVNEFNSHNDPTTEAYTISEMHRNYVSEYTYQVPLSELGIGFGKTVKIKAKSDLLKYDPLTGSYIAYKASSEMKSGDDHSLVQNVQYLIRKPFITDDGSIELPRPKDSSLL